MATKGNKEAFLAMYENFTYRAKNAIKNVKDSGNFPENGRDFGELIDKTFFKILNEYNKEKCSFSSFVEFVLNNRFAPTVRNALKRDVELYLPLENNVDTTTPIESLADPNQYSINEDIAINHFKYKMSSRGKARSNLQKKRDKILLYQYAGYSNQEICELMHMTYSQLRTHMEHIKKHRDVVNLKLELK